MRKLIGLLFASVALAACSGGGGGDSSPSSSTPPASPPANEGSTNDFIVLPSVPRVESSESDSEETSEMAENPFLADGLWHGYIRDAWGYMPSYDVLCLRDGSAADCLVMQHGKIIGFMRGELTVGPQTDTPDVAVSFDVFLPGFPDTIASKSGIGRLMTGTPILDANLDHERYVLSLKQEPPPAIITPHHPLAGVYAYALVNDEQSSFSVDEDGAFFGQSESGCVYSGTIQGRGIELTVANCGDLDGEYTGIALHAVPLYVRVPIQWSFMSMVGFAATSEGRLITGYGVVH